MTTADYSSTRLVSNIVSHLNCFLFSSWETHSVYFGKPLESRGPERLDFMADERNCFNCFQKNTINRNILKSGQSICLCYMPFAKSSLPFDLKQLVCLIIQPVWVKEFIQKIMLSLFTLPHVILKCLTFFLMRNTKVKSWRMLMNETLKRCKFTTKNNKIGLYATVCYIPSVVKGIW